MVYAATMKQRNKGGGDTMYKANLQRCRSVTLCISRLVSRFFVPASFICTQCTLFELYGFCDFLYLSPSHSHTTHSTFMFIPAFLFLHNKRISIANRLRNHRLQNCCPSSSAICNAPPIASLYPMKRLCNTV